MNIYGTLHQPSLGIETELYNTSVCFRSSNTNTRLICCQI